MTQFDVSASALSEATTCLGEALVQSLVTLSEDYGCRPGRWLDRLESELISNARDTHPRRDQDGSAGGVEAGIRLIRHFVNEARSKIAAL